MDPQQPFDPEKMEADYETASKQKWATDENHSKALVRFNEHFQAKTRFQTIVNSGCFIGGGLLSTLVTR